MIFGSVARAAILLTACGRSGFDPVVSVDAPAPTPGACANAVFTSAPASSFVDDFSTGALEDRWIVETDPCIAQAGGELVATPSPSGSYCLAWTRGDHHLTCDSIRVHVPEVTTPVLRAQTFIYVHSTVSDKTLYLLLEAGGFQLDFESAPDDYDPVADAWWQLREHDGELHFETAPDGITWRSRVTVATPFSLDHVEISLGAGTYMPVSTPGRARFRCLNMPPPCT